MEKAVLGGTFDPAHNGHLAIAEEVMAQLGLDEVVFIPARQPWLKKDHMVTPAKHRLNMLQLALKDKPHFRISTLELERAGDTYTIDTIAEMKSQQSEGDELFFIIGWDKLPELHIWRDVSRLLAMCRLVAVPRPGYSLPNFKGLEAAVPGASQRIVLLDKPEIDISASAIRKRVAQGLPIGDLVPGEVEGYIRRHSLYRSQR